LLAKWFPFCQAVQSLLLKSQPDNGLAQDFGADQETGNTGPD
jgi:hypothetical protein